MSKELENLLRLAALIAIFLVLIGVAVGRIRSLEKHIAELENAPADTVEVVKYDTIRIETPVPVYKYKSRVEYVHLVKDSLVLDTVKELVYLPREYMVYKDSSYRAVVSGVEPRLDSMEIYQKTRTEIITKTITKTRKTRWGVGVQAGMGWTGKKFQPYAGVGVQYNLLSW